MKPHYLTEREIHLARDVLLKLRDLNEWEYYKANQSMILWHFDRGGGPTERELINMALLLVPKEEKDFKETKALRAKFFSSSSSKCDPQQLYEDVSFFKKVQSQNWPMDGEELLLRTNRRRLSRIICCAWMIEVSGTICAPEVLKVCKTSRLMVWNLPTEDGFKMVVAGPLRVHERSVLYARELCNVVFSVLEFSDVYVRIFTHETSKRYFEMVGSDPYFKPPKSRNSEPVFQLMKKVKRWQKQNPLTPFDLSPSTCRFQSPLGQIMADFEVWMEVEERPIYFEWVGFWTEVFIRKKLLVLESFSNSSVCLMVDLSLGKELKCLETSENPRIFCYQGTIDVQKWREWCVQYTMSLKKEL